MPRKCSRSRKSTENVQISRRKKRTQTFNPKTTETNESSFSASAKKFKMPKEILVSRDPSIEYRILNFITVFAAISEYVQCTTSLLHIISALGLSLGTAAHDYAQKEDAERVMISDARALGSTREERMARRQHQLDLLEAKDPTQGPSYGPGIDDTMRFYNLQTRTNQDGRSEIVSNVYGNMVRYVLYSKYEVKDFVSSKCPSCTMKNDHSVSVLDDINTKLGKINDIDAKVTDLFTRLDGIAVNCATLREDYYALERRACAIESASSSDSTCTVCQSASSQLNAIEEIEMR
ncbi:hypothetical protein M0804_013811 [Polistes exclamans]|nr:hypothetical protein M0804_013811 [Polistes exclamans]